MTPGGEIALVIGAVATLLTAAGTGVHQWLQHRAGIAGREADAEERHMTRLERRVEHLEATQARLEETLRRRDAYIAELLAFIALHAPDAAVPTPPTE